MDRGREMTEDFYSATPNIPLLHPGLPPTSPPAARNYQRKASPLSPSRSSNRSLATANSVRGGGALSDRGDTPSRQSQTPAQAGARRSTTNLRESSGTQPQTRRPPSAASHSYAATAPDSPKRSRATMAPPMSQNRSSSIYETNAMSNDDLIADRRQSFRGYRSPDEAPIGTPLPAASYDDGAGSRSTSFASHDHLKDGGVGGSTAYLGSDEVYDYPIAKKRSNKKWWCLGAALALILIAAAVGLGIYFGVVQPNNNANAAASKSNAGQSSSRAGGGATGPTGTTPAGATSTVASSSASPSPTVATSGTNGSIITMENGTQFTYINSFGGNWTSIPYDNSAKAQSYTPALNQPWNYGVDKIRGVNIGGWLVTEPFIAPALYEPYVAAGATDEYSLVAALGTGAAAYLTQHYDTFITEQDFAEIAGAGLNWVRIPVGYWAIEVLPGEPFVAKVSWSYFLKAVEWARKYGLRINFDFHALPGSQNSWNHSGKGGAVGFLSGVLGVLNAQRGLNYMREIAEFISQPQYKNVIPIYGPINEPQQSVIGETNLRSFYVACYEVIRAVTGTGAGVQQISLHDAFDDPTKFYGFLNGGAGIALDSHKYLVFGSNPQTGSVPSQMYTACNSWPQVVNTTMTQYGLALGGEFSGATDDCGQWINGVGQNPNYAQVMDCSTTQNWWLYTAAQKSLLNQWIKAQMDIFGNFFFWTWKTGPSAQFGGRIANPEWSYQLGLQQGWILPNDAITFPGTCNALNAQYNWGGLQAVPFNGVLPASATGAGGVVPTPDNQGYTNWPSQSPYSDIARYQMAFLPTLTPTGALATLPDATGVAGAGDGWANTADNVPFYTQVAGCPSYPAYSGRSDAATPLDVPTAACTGAGAVAVTDVPAGTVQAAKAGTVAANKPNHGNIALPTATAKP